MRAYLLALFLPFFVSASLTEQKILSPPAMAQDPFHDSISYTPKTTIKPTLTDLLTIQPSASIYYSYARDTEFSREFSVDDNEWTLLVPTNKAIMALSRKPHQGPVSVESDMDMSEQQLDERSRHNVEQWIAAHIIPHRISFADVPVTYQTLLEGRSVSFKPASGNKNLPDWERVTLEDGIRIVERREGGNGVIYMIDGTITPTN